eukprot:3017881-Amphidinium_carterae.1
MRDYLERALRIVEAYYGPDHPQVAATLASLGTAYGDLGDALKMRDYLERALRIVEPYYGPEHPGVGLTLSSLGNAYRDLGDASKMRDYLERAWCIVEAYYGPEHPEVGKILTSLGNAYGDLGDASKILEARLFGKGSADTTSGHNAGKLGHRNGDASKMRDYVDRALQIVEADYGSDHADRRWKNADKLGPCSRRSWRCFED